MPRYIDADKLIAHLKDEIEGCKPPFGGRTNGKSIAYGTILGLKSAISFAETLSTADVVPKSEYDAVVSAVDNSTKEFLKLHDKYQEAKREIENLKVLLEVKDVSYAGLKELYDTDTTALIEAREKTEVEVAREIFEEIENVLNQRVQLYYTIAVTTFDSIEQAKSMASESTLRAFRDYIAELKKKYTEGE